VQRKLSGREPDAQRHAVALSTINDGRGPFSVRAFPHIEGRKGASMLGTILIVILILALLGALPRWSHSRDWGYYPTGGVGLILFVVIILLVLGRI